MVEPKATLAVAELHKRSLKVGDDPLTAEIKTHRLGDGVFSMANKVQLSVEITDAVRDGNSRVIVERGRECSHGEVVVIVRCLATIAIGEPTDSHRIQWRLGVGHVWCLDFSNRTIK